MTGEQGLLRLLWGGGRSWSATALYMYSGKIVKLFSFRFYIVEIRIALLDYYSV